MRAWCAVALVATVGASAAWARPAGIYEIKTVRKDGKRLDFAQLFLDEVHRGGLAVKWARMTFDFAADDRMSARVEILTAGKDGKAHACEAEVGLDVSWEGDVIVIPVTARAVGRVVQIDKKQKTKSGGKGVSVTDTKTSTDSDECNASLTKGRYRVRADGGVLVFQGVEQKEGLELVPAEKDPHYDQRF